MSGFAQWVDDWMWAANMVRARRFRRKLMFSRREVFDKAIRPEINADTWIAYPDAVYHIKTKDVARAMIAALTRKFDQ